MRLQRVILMLIVALAPLGQAFAQAAVGEVAPQFALKDTKGGEVSLAALKGKTVVLEWTNAECPFVKKHYGSGNMQKTQAYAAEKGAVWISVISSAEGKQGYISDAEANDLTTQRDAKPAHVIRDPKGELGHLYGAKTTPHIFVIDADGKVAYRGAIDSAPTADPADIKGATNYVTAALDALAAGKQPEISESQPYGCSVKY